MPAITRIARCAMWFVQEHQSLARSEGGLGIGLTLLWSLVEFHDGRVEAQSDGPGRGSTFTVWLPLEMENRTGRPPAGRAWPRARTVALVEDQPPTTDNGA